MHSNFSNTLALEAEEAILSLMNMIEHNTCIKFVYKSSEAIAQTSFPTTNFAIFTVIPKEYVYLNTYQLVFVCIDSFTLTWLQK